LSVRLLTQPGRYDTVDAVEDIPTAFYYESMLQQYPEAKFILTVRDEEDWFASFSVHHADTLALYGGVLPFRLQALTELVYGTAEINKEIWIEHYRAHNARVQAVIPASQLLVLNVFNGDGWAELCSFLGAHNGPCSDMTSAFPVSNTLSDRQSRVNFQSLPKPSLVAPNTNAFAYVSLLAHPSHPEHRDFFRSFLVAATSLRKTGTTYDIIALVYGGIDLLDQQLLEELNIKVKLVGGLGASLESNFEAFDEQTAAIYRAKGRVLQLVDYDVVMMFDADVIFHKNCDDMFNTPFLLHGRSGSNSPFNAGVFLVRPSWQALVDMTDVSLTRSFTIEKGLCARFEKVDFSCIFRLARVRSHSRLAIPLQCTC
jgi:hypothetical protein